MDKNVIQISHAEHCNNHERTFKKKRSLCRVERHRPLIDTNSYVNLTNAVITLRSGARLNQPDIVKEHLAGTAGCGHIASCTQTDCDLVNVAKIDALVGKGL